MATTTTHCKMGIVDSLGNVNVLYPQTTGSDVSIAPSGNITSTNVQDLVSEIDGSGSNPNILLNPFFTINQRGQSTYSAGVTFDRWNLNSTSPNDSSVSKNNDIVTLTPNTGGKIYFLQYIDPDISSNLLGKNLTLSVKLGDDNIVSSTHTIRSTFPTSEIYTGLGVDCGNGFRCHLQLNATKLFPMFYKATEDSRTLTIKAIKLEVSGRSTLHLDTYSEYSIELAKCRGSVGLTNDSYANKGDIVFSGDLNKITHFFAVTTVASVTADGTKTRAQLLSELHQNFQSYLSSMDSDRFITGTMILGRSDSDPLYCSHVVLLNKNSTIGYLSFIGVNTNITTKERVSLNIEMGSTTSAFTMITINSNSSLSFSDLSTNKLTSGVKWFINAPIYKANETLLS